MEPAMTGNPKRGLRRIITPLAILLAGTAFASIPTPLPTTPTPPPPTRTATPTPPATGTPTCAATGTPYCAAVCRPCEEVRPGCLKFACGMCFENPQCNNNEVCVAPGPIAANGCCSCATVTPTGSPCVMHEEERLTFEFASQPAEPRVGDLVTFTFHVRNTTNGLAGIPSYTLLMTPQLFAGASMPQTTGVTSLGEETVTFHRQAAQEGTSAVQLSVYYETQRGCIGQSPTFFFRSMASPEYAVAVGA